MVRRRISETLCQTWLLISVYQQRTFNDSSWLKSRWFQTVSNCSCWQTSIGQPVFFEYGTGCQWHPSNQMLQCPVITIRCYPWSAGSWQVFHVVGLCVFSRQSADYSIVVPYSKNTGCPIDVCQQEQLETVWNQRDLSQEESLNVRCW
jgi:hypothetical protein